MFTKREKLIAHKALVAATIDKPHLLASLYVVLGSDAIIRACEYEDIPFEEVENFLKKVREVSGADAKIWPNKLN